MIEQQNKCKHCGAEVTGEGDECYKCIDNPKRQKFFAKQRKQPLTYLTCPNEGEVLQILETDAEGKPTKYYCPVCREETAEVMEKTYDPEIHCYDFFCDDPEKRSGFKPARVAESIKDNFLFKTDIKTDILYRFDDVQGMWRRDGEKYLSQLVAKSLGKDNRECHFRNILFHLKSITLQDVEFKTRWIATLNCLLDPETRLTKPFTPNEFVVQKIPVEFKPGAECPANIKFLAEVLEPDQIPIIQEALGYSILKAMPIHTSIVLLGEGANGKSTLLNVINAFLGAENASHVTLQQLCEGKFELARLHNKLANICDDLPSDSLKSVSNFKNLTGNAPIQGQHKFKDPFDFLSYAKLFWACNKLPPASEDTVAYYRRFIILNFNHTFTGDKADTKLLEKLTTPDELSGLLNWALDGLKRLLKNEQFTNAKSIEETRSQYIRTADSTQAFIEERSEISQNASDYVTDETLYREYVAYCNTFKLPIQKKAQLTIAMQKTRPEAKHTNQRVQGKVTHVWQYLKLKESVATVATVAGFSILAEDKESQNITKVEDVVTLATPATNLTAKDCLNFHKASCEHANPTCLTPLFDCLVSCRGFKPHCEDMPDFPDKVEPPTGEEP